MAFLATKSLSCPKSQFVSDDTIKSNALYKYITEERFKGRNIIGGIVIEDNNIFKYYQQAIYKTYNEAPELWENFDNILK